MRLLTPPWKTAWYDDRLSDKFFQEMTRQEKNSLAEIETSAQWMEQLVIEFGQLAQNMIQLEKPSPQTSQIRQAFEKALKLSALTAHLTSALDRADPDKQNTPVGNKQERLQAGQQPLRAAPQPALQVKPGMPGAPAGGIGKSNGAPATAPPRETILGLSRKGLSIAEIEIITGQPRNAIENLLSARG